MRHTPVILLAVALLVVMVFSPSVSAQKAPELLFKVTFDDLTSNAVTAKGNPRSTLTRDLGLTAKEGYNKKSALLLGDGEECAYEVKGNMNLSAATISFWCRPYNWDDKLGRYQKFFWVHGFENKVPFGVYVDSPPGGAAARVVMSYGKPRKLYQFNAKADWNSKKWHKIDVTWDARHLAIYVNGRLGERKEIEGIVFPRFDHRKFMLAPIYHSGDGRYHNGKDRSLIDDFEVWDGVLSADRILQRYIAETGGDVAAPTLAVARAAGRIKLDGRLDDAAWKSASRVPIPIRADTMYPNVEWAYASICYDDANVYIGFESPKGQSTLAAKAAPRDGKVWEDDAFELFLNPNPKDPKRYYQIIVNSKGAFFDAYAGSKKWNGALAFKAHVGKDTWTVEAKIPFKELKTTTPKAGDMWLGNFCRDFDRPAPAYPIYTSWAYLPTGFLSTPERFGRLHFIKGTRGVRLTLSPMLNAGSLDVTAEGMAGKLTASVLAHGALILNESSTKGRIKKRLEGVKEGTLTLAMKPKDGTPGLSYSTRIMVKEPIDVATLPDPSARRLGFLIDLANIDATWKKPVAAGKVKLTVSFKGPKADKGSTTFDVKGPRGTYTIPFAFETGAYEMTYALTEPGHAKPMLMVKPLNIPPLPWVGTKVGLTDEVLKPWTPLKYTGKATVACWNREYTFNGPFLAKAVNGERDLLAGPIAMKLATARGTGMLASKQARATLKKPHRAEFAGKADFGRAGVKVDWSTWMEYDGVTVTTLTLHPARGGSTLKRLGLRIPLRSDVATYLRGRRNMGSFVTGRIPWDGKRLEEKFTPMIWACNLDEGFVWFCESQAGWVYPEKAKPIIVQGGKEAFIELRLITQDAKLTKPLRYTFGFQATPVKPLARDRRAWNFGMHRPTKHINARNWMTGYAEQDGHYKVLNVTEMRKWDARQRAMGVKMFYYGTTSCTPDHNPTYNLYEKLWANAFSASYPNRNRATRFRKEWVPYRLGSVCPGSASFQEFMIYYAEEFLRQCGVPGLYTDTDGIFACDNPYHGHRFTDVFGKSGVTYTVLSKRNFAKRMAAIARSFKNERRYWMTHAHAKLVPPVHGWADFWLPGEENTHQMRGNKWWYMHTLDDLAWRVEYRGTSSGVVHEFLPEFVRGTKDKRDMHGPQPSESLLAMCAVTDVNTTGAYMNPEAMGVFWGLRKNLGLIDADFTGYWQAECAAKALTEQALASVYRTKKGAAVIAIANRLTKATTVQVMLNLKALKLGRAAKAVDGRTGKAVSLKGGVLSVPVEARNYTFVTVQ